MFYTLIELSETFTNKKKKIASENKLFKSLNIITIESSYRQCNFASHTLARWSLECNFFGYFNVGNSPSCFVSVVRGETGWSIQFGFLLGFVCFNVNIF